MPGLGVRQLLLEFSRGSIAGMPVSTSSSDPHLKSSLASYIQSPGIVKDFSGVSMLTIVVSIEVVMRLKLL
jgi:hypothetical protein